MDFLEDSDNDSNQPELKINQKYADHYESFRQKEQLMKLEAKYGKRVTSSSSRSNGTEGEGQEEESDHSDETSSSDDSDTDFEIPSDMEQRFLATLSSLKSRDPKIYDNSVTFFEEGDVIKPISSTHGGSKSKDKPLFLSDMERKVMLEKEGKFEEIEDSAKEAQVNTQTYEEEQRHLQKEIRRQVQNSGEPDFDENDDCVDGLFKLKSKSANEKAVEDRDYRLWLKDQTKQMKDGEMQSKLAGLKKFWSNSEKLDEGEKFLRDFILNKRYNAPKSGFDTVDELKASEDTKAHDSDENLSEDEKTIEKMEIFEHKYNYRFEEPDTEFIKQYPRTIESSMRKRPDSVNKRREKRREKAEMKTRVKEEKRQELEQLKILKENEIRSKLDLVCKVAGAKFGDNLKEDENFFDGDFDPEEYDEQMARLFENYDDDLSQIENSDGHEEAKRPEIDVAIRNSKYQKDLQDDNWDSWKEHEYKSCGVDAEKNIDSGKSFRNVVKKRFKQQQNGDVSNEQDFEKIKDAFNKYLQSELDALEYEDIVGGVACRFKYRSVPANDFGLKVDEILSAPDRELNSWCSLKKTCQYRSNEDESYDINLFKSRGKNEQLKHKLMPSLFEDDNGESGQSDTGEKAENGESKKRKRNKKKKKTDNKDSEIDPMNIKVESQEESTSNDSVKKASNKEQKKKSSKNCDSSKVSTTQNEKGGRRKQFSKLQSLDPKSPSNKFNVNATVKMSNDRLEAYGLAPNQFKRKMRGKFYKEKAETAATEKS